MNFEDTLSRKASARRARLGALVAEDDRATRNLITTILEREGFEVHGVPDGQNAIDLVKKSDFALIILDVLMPGIDGFGVLRYIRQYRPSTIRRIIVTTAMPPAEVEAFCEGEVCQILPKPFDVTRLAQIAKECAADEAEVSSEPITD